jgi:hypothetical protein
MKGDVPRTRGDGMGGHLIAHLNRDPESKVTGVRVLVTLVNGCGSISRVKSDHEYDIARSHLSLDDEIQQIDKKQHIRVLVLLGLSL